MRFIHVQTEEGVLMNTRAAKSIASLLKQNEGRLLEAWMKEQLAAPTLRLDLIGQDELRRQSGEFLRLLTEAAQSESLTDTATAEWGPALEFLGSVSRSRTAQGFRPSETATFILSLKQPLFAMLRGKGAAPNAVSLDDIWTITVLLDKMALFTTEKSLEYRDEVIKRQQRELLELSTPVVQLWDGILALPLIGTLDSARTQVIMENLLQRITETGSTVAIIDITGVPTVDTLVAQHLLKTIAAARLMGADCIISGIRPVIAQTIIHLGVSLQDVVTKATLADALGLALRQRGLGVAPTRAAT
jgi:rsbT co-antagonist protein RsbR